MSDKEMEITYEENNDNEILKLKMIGEYDLLASKEVKKVNFVSRLLKSLNYLIWGDV